MGSSTATSIDIRIGAFDSVPASGFDNVGAVGFGPPGNDLSFPDALAGDIMFNFSATFLNRPGNEGDSYDPFNPFGNDLENLMLHELGHAAIGLGHPNNGPGDVMYVGNGCCDFINRELSPDDILGARTVYGVSSIPEPSPVLLLGIPLMGFSIATIGRKSAKKARAK